jgi:hypothetical protein
MHTRDDLISQVISIRKKYPTYSGFGRATMQDLWSDKDKENAVILKATDMNTSLLKIKVAVNSAYRLCHYLHRWPRLRYGSRRY